MRAFLLLVVLPATIIHGEEPAVATMREKLRAKIMESVPPPPVKPPEEKKPPDDTTSPVLVMKPVIVSESKLIQHVTTAIAREEQSRKDEQFSPLDGGTIAKVGPVYVGNSDW